MRPDYFIKLSPADQIVTFESPFCFCSQSYKQKIGFLPINDAVRLFFETKGRSA